MKEQVSTSFTRNAHKALCGGDGFGGKVTRTFVLKLFCNLIIFGTITMQNAQASDNNGYLDNEKLSRSFSNSHCITELAWSPDQSKIAVRGIGQAYLWDVVNDEQLWNARGTQSNYTGLAISPDNQYFIMPSSGEALPGHPDTDAKDAALTLLPTVESDSPIPKYIKDPGYGGGLYKYVEAFSLSPDGKLAAAVDGSSGGWTTIYDTKTWQPIKHIGQFKNPWGIVVNPTKLILDSARKLLIGAYVTGDVQVWNYEKNTKVSQFQISQDSLQAIALNPINGEIVTSRHADPLMRFPNGYTVGVPDDNANADDLVKAWNPSTGKLIRSYPGTKYDVHYISVSPDGHYIAGTEGGSRIGVRLHLWNAATGALLKTIEYSSFNGLSPVQFSPDSRQLAVGNDDEVHIYDLTNNP
ncbi:MAG: hypothetical protein P4N59_05525 [Negativicutes bacterium]|nr:hypothetical protein [Negativicutes bacterium]